MFVVMALAINQLGFSNLLRFITIGLFNKFGQQKNWKIAKIYQFTRDIIVDSLRSVIIAYLLLLGRLDHTLLLHKPT